MTPEPSEAAADTLVRKSSVAPVLMGVVGIGALVLWMVARGGAAKLDDSPLPLIAPVPSFSLTERSGEIVTDGDLRGRVWVVDFVFTTCAGPCPEMSMRMRSLQGTLKETERDVTLVTISVDPATDTPKVLARYADKYHAEADRWLFLTGESESEIRTLVLDGFLQALSPATERSPIIHSTRFVMVGRNGHIRGFHDGLDVSVRDQLLHDLDKLLNEPLRDD